MLLRGYGDPTPEQSADWLREAEASIHRALALDPDLSEAHDAYATLLRDTGRPGAEDEYKRALELNPNNASAWHNYAVFLGNSVGRLKEATHATLRTLELDPRHPAAWANYLSGMLGPGSQRYKDEVARAIRTIGDMPDSLNFVGIATTQFGYPVETMKIALAKRRLNIPEVAGAWIFEFRAWLPVDLDRAAAALPRVDAHSTRDFPRMIRLYSEAEVAGLRGDWVELDRLFGQLKALVGDKDPSVRSTMAFWLAVQGRYDEAAESLALVGPLPDTTLPPRLGGDTTLGLLEPAVLRIHRATGRDKEAGRLRERARSKRLRTDRRAAGTGCDWDGWMRYASLAANEGLKDEAVDALRGAMRCGDLPYGFRPQLPWFRSLEGYAPYDELLRERGRRVEKIRAQLLQLEASAARPAEQSD